MKLRFYRTLSSAPALFDRDLQKLRRKSAPDVAVPAKYRNSKEGYI
jgi:hypothetical protein